MDDDTEDDSQDGYEFEPNMFGGGFMSQITQLVGADVGTDPSEEVELAMRLLRASAAISEFVSYAEANDVEIDRRMQYDMATAEQDERCVMIGYLALAHAINELGEYLEDDDDEDSPFKVSDGDDPVY